MATAVAVQVGFAALGAVIGEVLRLIKEVKDKIKRFKRELERLESTLTSVLPRLEKIRDSKIEISDTLKAEIERLIAKLKKAKKLVPYCTRLRVLDVVKKVKISSLLRDVDESVVRFVQVDLQMEIWETTKGIESLLGKIDRNMRRLLSKFKADQDQKARRPHQAWSPKHVFISQKGKEKMRLHKRRRRYL